MPRDSVTTAMQNGRDRELARGCADRARRISRSEPMSDKVSEALEELATAIERLCALSERLEKGE